jgi:DnaK suppressor protein
MTDRLTTLLEEKRTELEAEMARLTQPPSDQATISFGKRIGDGTTTAIDRLSRVAAYDRLQQMVDDVARAQVKLAEGSYGSCDGCGTPIPAERLDALPWAVLCLRCANRR